MDKKKNNLSPSLHWESGKPSCFFHAGLPCLCQKSGYNQVKPEMERVLGMANLITILRFPLLVLQVFLLYSGNPTVVLCSIALLIIVILMDSLDGIVARRRGETSLLGSALDIARRPHPRNRALGGFCQPRINFGSHPGYRDHAGEFW